MKLSPMRYKDYAWPHNPKTYEMTYKRSVSPVKLPFGGWIMQDMGKTYRVLRGQGEFVGMGAYNQFKKLAEVFKKGGAGALIHPIWQMTNALFVSLTLAQEPRENYVAYTFEFWEDNKQEKTFKVVTAVQSGNSTYSPRNSAGKIHTVVAGDTMWDIANENGMSVYKLIELNPQIRNPNLIHTGDIIHLSEVKL